MKFIAILITGLLLSASIALAAPKNNVGTSQSNGTTNSSRGGGLENAIQHVPDFVAEKLNYMRGLFASGINGIGKSLSDWIHANFQPVVKGNETENKTK